MDIKFSKYIYIFFCLFIIFNFLFFCICYRRPSTSQTIGCPAQPVGFSFQRYCTFWFGSPGKRRKFFLNITNYQFYLFSFKINSYCLWSATSWLDILRSLLSIWSFSLLLSLFLSLSFSVTLSLSVSLSRSLFLSLSSSLSRSVPLSRPLSLSLSVSLSLSSVLFCSSDLCRFQVSNH